MDETSFVLSFVAVSFETYKTFYQYKINYINYLLIQKKNHPLIKYGGKNTLYYIRISVRILLTYFKANIGYISIFYIEHRHPSR